VASDAATAFCAYPLTHRSMLRLASLSNALLERNIEAAAALRFRRGFLQRMTTLGTRLDALCSIPPGTGRELLHQGYALLLGLWQLEEPAPVILEVMSGDEIESFGADFERRALNAVRSLWRGAVAGATSA
jgi:hypothetical protein